MSALQELQDKAMRWSSEFEPELDYNELLDHIEFLARRRFFEYLPSVAPGSDQFIERLAAWLDNASESETDQKILLRTVPEIAFVGSLDFAGLYRAAFQGAVTRWLIGETKVTLEDQNLGSELREAIATTWFCAITDSMTISSFCHTNALQSQSTRPDWLSLSELGALDRIRAHMDSNGLKRIILLEDFVGSGHQMRQALQFVMQVPGAPSVLAVPLLCCSRGVAEGSKLARESDGQLAFEAVLTFDAEDTVLLPSEDIQAQLFPLLVELANRRFLQVSGGIEPDSHTPPYGPLGFMKSGALVVTHTNTPNNTLPLVHHRPDSRSWSPLFPRSRRGDM